MPEEKKGKFKHDSIQLGDIILSSHIFNCKELSEIIKELLKDLNVARYLGLVAKAEMKKLSNMFG